MSGGEHSDAQPLGHILDALGVRASVDQDQFIEAAMVLLKLVDHEGKTRLVVASSAGLGWLERVGMLHVAELTESSVTPPRP